MITVSEDARQYIEAQREKEPQRKWFLFIEWKLGEMNNTRAADGAAVWRREPDIGWRVNLVGYPPDVAFDRGDTVVPGVRAVVLPAPEHPFPGGTIEYADGWLQVVPNAT